MKRWVMRPQFITAIILIVLTATSIETAVVYFGQYVRDPQLYIQSDGDLADIAHWLNTHDTQGEPVYIAALHYRHPTIAALTDKYSKIRWIAGNRGIVLPNGPGYLFFARLGLPDQQWPQKVLPDAALVDAPLAPDGATNYRLYHLDAQPTITPQVKLDVNFGNIVQLMGYDVEQPSASLRSAPNTSVTLYWRVLNKPDRGDYSTFAQLYDARGFEWGKGGSFDYPSEEWSPGEIIVNRIDVPIGTGAPPGAYELRVGWFSPETQQRINIVAPDGSFGGTVARLQPISVETATTDATQVNPGTRLNWDVAPGLKLLGYTQPTTQTQPGAPIDVTLYWQNNTPVTDEPIKLQLSSCGCKNQPVTTTVLTTTTPADPFSQWPIGAIMADRYHVRVPFDMESGDYTLEVVVGDGEPIELGAVNVQQADRVMSEPPIAHRMNVRLTAAIELVGYNLDQTADTIKLTLIWKSLQALDQDYTVFTHVLDRSGQQIAGKDNHPVNGTYPTSRWMPGEYVIDEYVIPTQLPDGYAIEVGMYDPETGARLGETLQLK